MSDHPPPAWNGPDAPTPPQFPPPPPAQFPAGRRRSMGVWIAVAIAAVLVIGGGVVAATVLNSSEPVAAAEPVTLEPAGSPGSDPFLASVTVTEVTAFPDSVLAVAKNTAGSMSTDAATGTLTTMGTSENLYGGSQTGSTELYGGSGELGKCDISVLADYLAENPDKAKAWAGARNIAASQIAEYLKTLTPVVLLHDTRVTNYGFSNGVAVPYQAVLQAGTGVLVDWTGQPAVRCACGNPLSAPKPINLPSAELLGTRWDGYDPARTVGISGGPVTAGFVLVDVLTGESFTRPVGFTVPVAAVAPTPTPAATTAPAPAVATSGPECAFDLGKFGSGTFGNRAWVDGGTTGRSCAEMIEKWRRYEAWTGPVNGMVQWVEFDDGWRCDFSWVPLTQPEYIDGSVGTCGIREILQDGFVVWYGEYGEHKVPQTTEAAPSAAPTTIAPAPAAGTCFLGELELKNGGWAVDGATDLTCEQMLDQWNQVLANPGLFMSNSESAWKCQHVERTDYGGCYNRELGHEFMISYQHGGAASGGSDGTSDTPTGDLGLSTPMTRPSCDGTGIVVLFSATTPGAYEAEVQQALNQHPGSSYLRTDQSCSSLNQSYQGNPIYAVYRVAGNDRVSLCELANVLGGYGRWLDNSSDPNTDPC